MRSPNHLMPCTCTGEPLYYSGRLISWEVSRIHTYDYYQEAIAWQEQQKMPHVGLSIDRRTLKHLSRGLCECPPTSLICACCMCQYTMLDGTNGEMGRIGAYTYFSQISAKCFQSNWCFEEYMKHYGKTSAMENHEDLGKKSKFKRILMYPNFRKQAIICCPEDIKCAAEHDSREIYECCQLPLCYRCLQISLKTTEDDHKIPRALANDNFYGFVDPTIVEYGVRWIELAAASPILNCIVCYYVEGDRGHLLDEQAFQRRNAINVRGNAYSFAMPWDQIADRLSQVVDGQVNWSELPQSEDLLARTVLFNLRIGNVVALLCRRKLNHENVPCSPNVYIYICLCFSNVYQKLDEIVKVYEVYINMLG